MPRFDEFSRRDLAALLTGLLGALLILAGRRLDKET